MCGVRQWKPGIFYMPASVHLYYVIHSDNFCLMVYIVSTGKTEFEQACEKA